MMLRRMCDAILARLSKFDPLRLDGRSAAIGLAVGLLLASFTLWRSLAAPDGYLSPDSTNYLALSRALLAGHGFMSAGDGTFPAAAQPFTVWPVGYPVLIYLFARLSGASVFLSAKLLDGLLLAATTTMLGTAAGRGRALAIVLLPGCAGFIEIYSYAWSEIPFIAFALAAAIAFARVVRGADKPGGAKSDLAWSVFLALCCLGLFLMRYIGAFALCLLGLAVLSSLLRRAWRMAGVQAVLLALTTSAILAYLHHNALLSGFSTGMARVAPTDDPSRRLAMLASALWSEVVLPVAEFDQGSALHWLLAGIEAAGLVALAMSIRRQYSHPLRALSLDAFALGLLTTGGVYLVAIIYLRWTNQFDPYNFRLLGPGTLLVGAGLLQAALRSWPRAGGAITAFVAAMTALSLLSAAHDSLDGSPPGYFASARRIERHAASIPPGSVVVFGDIELRYLRTDLFVTEPICPPWSDRTIEWSDFIQRLDQRHPIYIDMGGDDHDVSGCPRSVRDAVARFRPGAISRLVPPARSDAR